MSQSVSGVGRSEEAGLDGCVLTGREAEAGAAVAQCRCELWTRVDSGLIRAADSEAALQ